MNYKIVQNINEQTKLAFSSGKMYILKQICISDTDMYKKLMTLQCDNVIKFYETVTLDGKFYIVEEYVNGMTLSEYLDLAGCLNEAQTSQIVLQVCAGLEAVHKLGIIHRDINPNNIMITPDGTVKIIDFGISRTVKVNQSLDTQILGTQGFTAPEQFGFHQTGQRADIYSVGVLINYIRTKKLPHEKLTSGYLSEIVLKATRIDEADRYGDICEITCALQKKRRKNKILRTVPGFRQGVWWHGVIACIYYLILDFFLIIAPISAKSFFSGCLYFLYFFFSFAVPVPILTNFLNWTDRLQFIANKRKGTKILIQIVFAICSVLLSFSFIIASP